LEVSDKNLSRFKRAVKQLNSVIGDCKKDNPDCVAYLDGNNHFCLLSGEREIGEDGVDETIIADENLDANGGDW